VKNETLVDALEGRLTQKKVEILSDTLAKVETEVLVTNGERLKARVRDLGNRSATV